MNRKQMVFYNFVMETVVWPVNPHDPEPTVLQRAAEILRSGGLVAIPTETVYGLAAHALDPVAVERIFQAKGRPAINPLIVHVADVAMAQSLVSAWPQLAERLVERFWPGPLTLVLPKAPHVPSAVTAGGDTVALRCPDHLVARGLIAAAQFPLAAPSANLSCQLSPTLAAHVLRDLRGRIEAVVDAGATPGGIESTVLDLTEQPTRLLRPGPISKELLESMTGPMLVGANPNNPALPRSPGQMTSHYSPRTPLVLFNSARNLRRVLDQARFQGQRIGVVGFDQARGVSSAGKLRFHPGISYLHWLPDEPLGYASKLYWVLHDLDDRKLDRIFMLLPPDEPKWLAVRDRLLRAGHLGDAD